jgi:curved DNA-binding protein CbpA
MTENYYSILGVAETASADEIKARFRFLSQAYHPDKFPAPAHKQSAEEEFKRINQAYQVLSDSAQRARYDATRATAAPRSPKPAPQRPASSAAPEPGYQRRDAPSPPPPSAAQEPPKAFPSRKLVSPKSVLLGISLSVVMALVLKAAYAYLASYWLLDINRAARRVGIRTKMNTEWQAS